MRIQEAWRRWYEVCSWWVLAGMIRELWRIRVINTLKLNVRQLSEITSISIASTCPEDFLSFREVMGPLSIIEIFKSVRPTTLWAWWCRSSRSLPPSFISYTSVFLLSSATYDTKKHPNCSRKKRAQRHRPTSRMYYVQPSLEYMTRKWGVRWTRECVERLGEGDDTVKTQERWGIGEKSNERYSKCRCDVWNASSTEDMWLRAQHSGWPHTAAFIGLERARDRLSLWNVMFQWALTHFLQFRIAVALQVFWSASDTKAAHSKIRLRWKEKPDINSMQVCLVLVLADKSMRRNPRPGTRTMFQIEGSAWAISISQVNLRLIPEPSLAVYIRPTQWLTNFDRIQTGTTVLFLVSAYSPAWRLATVREQVYRNFWWNVSSPSDLEPTLASSSITDPLSSSFSGMSSPQPISALSPPT